MRLITRKNKAAVAAQHWHNVYYDQRFGWRHGPDKTEIWEKLNALGKNPNPDDVDRIIGNTSWTDCVCDECGKHVDKVVEVGQEPDYDSATAHLCTVCLVEAVLTLNKGG